MTFAEVERAIDSRERVLKQQEKRQASFDYILADLIGRSVARVYNSANKLPPIGEVYPSLFNNGGSDEDYLQKQRDELSVIRFKQFAQFHNKKFEEVR